ncbi:MAG: hydroxymethylglutaryl-CoA synthase [Candidatus Levyibacteriota bacterium]
MTGIISYGTYVPQYRIKISEIAGAWQKDTQEITSALRIVEKSVPNNDEDAITMGIEAGMEALRAGNIDPKQIQSVFVGSESHPYTVNPSSSTIAEILGIGPDYFAADLEFACKAATAGVGVTCGLLDSNKIDYGLVIGSDTAQAKPSDVIEFTAASASVALLLGKSSEKTIADVKEMSSFTSDTPDFWRRDGSRFPSHAGRFTGEPAYFHHILHEAKKLLLESKLAPTDFAYCVFHMPNGKFPQVIAKKLGFTQEQLKPSLTVESIGNPYSAAALLGLSAVLDIAKPKEKIFFVSYGSGAGSDGFIFETTKQITKWQKLHTPFAKKVKKKEYIGYVEYLKKMKNL